MPRIGTKALNTVLLAVGQSMQLGLVFATSVILARQLGPEGFGSLSFGLAVAGMLGIIATLGLQSLVSREMLAKPGEEAALLGTSTAIRSISGVVLLAGVASYTAWSRTDSACIAAIVSIPLAAAGIQSAALWFESHAEPVVPQFVKLTTLGIGAICKLTAVFNDYPLYAIATIYALEQLVDAIVVYLIVHRRTPIPWRMNRSVATRLLSNGWPIALGSIAAAVHLKADQLILAASQTTAEVGLYAAAVRLSEATYILATSAATIHYPALSKIHDGDRAAYLTALTSGYGVLFWTGAAVATGLTALSFYLIPILYGDAYLGCIPMLIIHTWACPAMFMRQLLSKGLIIERTTIHSLSTHGLGAAINLILCIWLTPTLGGVGAAIASLASYTFGTCVITFCFPATRHHAVAMLAGIRAGPSQATRTIRRGLNA